MALKRYAPDQFVGLARISHHLEEGANLGVKEGAKRRPVLFEGIIKGWEMDFGGGGEDKRRFWAIGRGLGADRRRPRRFFHG